MKRRVMALIIVTMFLLQGITVQAGLDNTIKVSIDGQITHLDNAPYVNTEMGRVLVPLRGVFEALGIVVDYNKDTQQVIAKTDDVEVMMNLYEASVLVNGQLVALDAGTEVFDQRTYVPIRFIAETFGHEVSWNGATRTVEIIKDGQVAFSGSELPTLENQGDLLALLDYHNTMNGYLYGGRNDMMVMDAVEESSASADNGSVAKSDGDFSDTNNQVKGVQESDVIKTDGNYIYQVVDGNIRIFDATPKAVKLITTIDPEEFSVSEIFLSEGKIVAHGQKDYAWIEPMPLIEAETTSVESNETGDIEPASKIAVDSIMPYYNEDRTYVAVYDIATVTAPVLISYYAFDGYFASGRVVDDYLYMATNKSFYLYNIYDMRKGTEPVNDAEILPSYKNLLTGEEVVLSYEDIAYFPDKVSSEFLLTIGLNLSDNKDVDVDAYLGYGGTIYVSNNHFYTSIEHYEYNTLESNAKLYAPVYDINTVIYKFEMNNGDMAYSTKGNVPGTMLNQFSLDEYLGNLRVATTKNSWWWNDEESTNHIFVLDKNLDQIGSVEDLAPGERIYSTRFVGEKIYMVTFKQVDPFFVIDASIPSEPKVLGYLKIPGFSTYMHPMDETHILGFGQETKLNEYGNVVTDGFKISLFDVSDFSNPLEADKLIIGKSGTYSELQYNHKALMYTYTTGQGVMALPISVAEVIDYKTSFSGAYVFDISTSDVVIAGRITHHDETTITEDTRYEYTNFDWNYEITRIIYIGDYLYTFSNNRIMVHTIDGLVLVSSLDVK